MKRFLATILISLFSISCFAQGDFARADSIALTARGNSIDELHRKLISQLNDDTEKLRSFYTWIANNIQYDFQESLRDEKSHQKQEPASVLKSHKAICHGYSVLFQELCLRSGINCQLVSGFTRFNNQFDNAGHTWNIVYVNGKWLPVDVTWGAGGVDAHGKYFKDFADRYFLTDPVEFLSSHYPFDPMWQLVKTPVKLQHYKNSAWVYENNSQTIFEFNDTIAAWLMLDSVEQEFSSALRMHRYGGDEPKINQQVSYAWFTKGNAAFENGNKIMEVLYPRKKNQTVAYPDNRNRKEKTGQLLSIDKFYKEAEYFYKQVHFTNPSDRAVLKSNTDALKYNQQVVKKELALLSK